MPQFVVCVTVCKLPSVTLVHAEAKEDDDHTGQEDPN